MFFLYHHHDLSRLADVLTALRQHAAASPLAADRVLVPNVGLGRWLKMHIAERDGIAANIETLLPAPFLWDVIAGGLPGGQVDSSAYRRENLRWHLYRHLPELAGEVPEIRGYLGEPVEELRRWQLAERLADLFDGYLIYRREMLLAWEKGSGETGPPGSWQAPLWRALVARLGDNHRARLLGRLIRRVEAGEAVRTDDWPERLYCFALGNLPPDYLRLLYAVGRYSDVHFLMHNPSAEYWGDIEKQPTALDVALDGEPLPGEEAAFEGHPLLASLGYASRDFLRLIYSDEFAGIREMELGEVLEYRPPGDDTLLHRLQSGVIEMDATPVDAGLAADDPSFQVHACHGPLREVQVLHDQLLDLLSADPTLHPRDIIVMTPDVAGFAPAIEAVFGAAAGAAAGAADGPTAIPFNLSDQPRRGTHPIVLTFRALLDLPLWRWSASELMSLVAVPAVMRRYRLDEGDVDNLERWIDAAGIRWGLDGAHREAAGAGHWNQNSWAFGLDRLLAGVAVSDPDALIDGVAPVVDLEGGATVALGELWLLIERLRHWRGTLPTPAPAAAWQERLNALVDDLFRIDPRDREEQAALDAVSEALAVLGTAAQALGDEPLSWEAVREIVDGELDASGARQPFLAGGVTFCGLVPLRTVPFRVVCLLGMNEGEFPRRDRDRAIDLIRLKPRLGDSSVRDDDRLLLLQWLLAARDVFYLSYTGQDTNTGEALAPSTAVAELLDFVAHNQLAGLDRSQARAALVTSQPMQPFSPRYFEARATANRIFTFRSEWHPGTRALFTERTELPPLLDASRAPAPDLDQVGLEELKRFFQHPSRYFLQEVLQLDLDTAVEQRADDEPLDLRGLDEHQLRQRLFDAVRNHGPLPESPPDHIRALGLLPPPPLDEAPYAGAAAELNRLLPVWERLRHTEDDVVPVDVVLPNALRLTGRLGSVAPDGLRRIEARRVSARQLLPHWIDLLALAATGRAATLHCCGLDGDGELDLRIGRVEPEQARSWLEALTDLYVEGQQRPLCFLPGTAGDFVELVDGDRGLDPDEALAKCNAHLAREFNPPWEVRDVWFRRVLAPMPEPLGARAETSEFCRVASEVVRPMTLCLAPVDDVDAWLAGAGP
jgi:exodeoxyribonuclease V gamma subunit